MTSLKPPPHPGYATGVKESHARLHFLCFRNVQSTVRLLYFRPKRGILLSPVDNSCNSCSYDELGVALAGERDFLPGYDSHHLDYHLPYLFLQYSHASGILHQSNVSKTNIGKI